MLPHWMSMMFSWANHICGETMLFMSLDPVVSLFLWGGHLYIIPKVVSTIVPPKKCHKVVFHTTKFSVFTICSKGEHNDTATTIVSPQAPSIQQKKFDKVASKHKDSFCTLSSHVALLVEHPHPQQVHDKLPQTKKRDVSNSASSSPRCRSSKCVSLSPRKST